MEVRVRSAGQEDVGLLVGLGVILFREDAGTRDAAMNLWWPEEEGWDHFAGLVVGENSVCLLVEVDGEVVGYLAGYVKEGTSMRPVRVAELESMCVREGYRSRGVGERLAGDFFRWAKSRGAGRVSVTAYAANGRAIHFYQKLGFRPRHVSLEIEVGG